MNPSRARREVVVRTPGGGDATWFLDNLLVHKIGGADGAPYALIEATLPAGSHTPFHRHEAEDEAFYVLDGELTVFFDGERVVRAVAGSYVHIPRGVAHGFRTETALRMLVITGTDGFAEMVREAGMPAPAHTLPPAMAPDFERLGRAADKFHIALLGPLPDERLEVAPPA
jgi:quercetin dioxygenase-like cupin family protein